MVNNVYPDQRIPSTLCTWIRYSFFTLYILNRCNNLLPNKTTKILDRHSNKRKHAYMYSHYSKMYLYSEGLLGLLKNVSSFLKSFYNISIDSLFDDSQKEHTWLIYRGINGHNCLTSAQMSYISSSSMIVSAFYDKTNVESAGNSCSWNPNFASILQFPLWKQTRADCSEIVGG